MGWPRLLSLVWGGEGRGGGVADTFVLSPPHIAISAKITKSVIIYFHIDAKRDSEVGGIRILTCRLSHHSDTVS